MKNKKRYLLKGVTTDWAKGIVTTYYGWEDEKGKFHIHKPKRRSSKNKIYWSKVQEPNRWL